MTGTVNALSGCCWMLLPPIILPWSLLHTTIALRVLSKIKFIWINMSLFILVCNYLKARPLNTAINILLLSLGIAVITILLLFKEQMEQKIEDNVRGIDLVV